VLADCQTEGEVTERFSKMSTHEWLDTVGPVGWEGLCLAYLIRTEDFVPTGLVAGRTLPTVDIAGRNRDGQRILAQCKKSPHPMDIDDDFLQACGDPSDATRGYYFAYGGIKTKSVPVAIRVLTREDFARWLEAEPEGQKYLQLARG
jgi:hypothetical protein